MAGSLSSGSHEAGEDKSMKRKFLAGLGGLAVLAM